MCMCKRYCLSFINRLLLIAIATLLAACATKTPAPVSDRRPPSATPAVPVASTPLKPVAVETKPAEVGKTHTVQKGDTLIGIALQYGLEYRELAIWNNIDNPNVIKVDEVLRVTPPTFAGSTPGSGVGKDPTPGAPVVTPLVASAQPSAAGERPATNTATLKAEPRGGKIPYTDQAYQRLSAQSGAATPGTAVATAPVAPATTAPSTVAPAPSAIPAAAPANEDVDWAWPVKGKLIASFTEANKGIDIAGSKGAAVNAAGAGKVIYSGSGLRGYGRLVIIKHNVTWFSAYAHNEKIVVAEGQEVKRGQKIAEMGNSDADQVKLHFEIRKNGKPLDPTKFLPAQ